MRGGANLLTSRGLAARTALAIGARYPAPVLRHHALYARDTHTVPLGAGDARALDALPVLTVGDGRSEAGVVLLLADRAEQRALGQSLLLLQLSLQSSDALPAVGYELLVGGGSTRGQLLLLTHITIN